MEFASKTRQAKPVQRAKASHVVPSRPVNRDSQAEIDRILRSVGAQAKLSIGQPNDKYEQEADRVADQVMTDQIVAPISSMDASGPPSAAGPSTQLKSNEYENEDEVQKKRIQRQAQPEEEEKPVQTKRIQRQAQPEEEDKPVQTKRIQRQTQPEEEEVQTCLQRMSSEEEDVQAKLSRKPAGYLQAKGTPELSDDAEQKIQQMRGQGDPLPKGVRQETENKIGADFSAVRIHNNSAANDINKQINARAFTLGNDIYFASGEYSPTTAPGMKLLAHELTHVVQQNSLVQRVIRRNNQVPNVLTNEFSDSRGRINTTAGAKTIQIKTLKVPTFKNRFYQDPQGKLASGAYNGKPTWRRNASTGGEERNTNQISIWETAIRTEADGKVDEKLRQAQTTEVNGKSIYYLSYNSGKSFLFGTTSTIKQRSRRPLWTARGAPVAMQVDHEVEYQTYGADKKENMWLLAAQTNGQSGREIRTEIREKVGAFVSHVQDKVLDPPSSIDDARTHYTVYFDPIQQGLGRYGKVREKTAYYTQDNIKNGDHLDGLHPMSEAEITASGILMGNAETINIFPSSTGGYHYTLTKDEGADTYHLSTASIRSIESKNFEITSVDFNAATKAGNIHIRVPSQSLADKLQDSVSPTTINPIAISPIEGIEWGGKFDAASLKRQVTEALTNFRKLSPLHIDDVSLNADGIALTGMISPTVPLIENAAVNFSLDGQVLSVWKSFSAEDISIPAPLSLNGTSLALGINNLGLFVSGNVGFGIDKVGQGSIGAAAEAGFDGETGISLSGDFDFDERIFGEGTQAQVRVGYANNLWSMGGTISIPEGKVPGVNSATIEVDYSEEEGFSASGDAELDVPGVESGRLEITHNEESGFSMGGEFGLSSETPGIRSGSISAQVREKEDGSGYAVSASGTAIPDIPGIDSEMAISYNDGAFTAEVTADYSRGMLSGQVNAGVTNRSVGEDGALSETADPGNPLIVYGGGNLTIQIAPWLQGTAGVQFSPNGEITVTGEIGLPSEFEIFPRREVNKSIFSIAVKAPVFPGIVAEIGGGLGAIAGLGPGVLDELRLEITYNPAHEEDTTIIGDAHLKVPADAGLRLSLRAGIGLGIPGVSVTGGLEIGGSLGIEGAAEAGVHVEWSPSKGLELMANVAIYAQPAFIFDIGGYVRAEAFFFTVYDQTWNFASFRFGSDYRFGINLPIHYREGEPFNISLSDVQFEVPNIDTNQLLKGLIARIA